MDYIWIIYGLYKFFLHYKPEILSYLCGFMWDAPAKVLRLDHSFEPVLEHAFDVPHGVAFSHQKCNQADLNMWLAKWHEYLGHFVLTSGSLDVFSRHNLGTPPCHNIPCWWGMTHRWSGKFDAGVVTCGDWKGWTPPWSQFYSLNREGPKKLRP